MKKRNFSSTSENKTRRNFLMANKASVYHAIVVIFLEFFAFGLLTAPMISVLDETFPKHTFLMNGLIQGVKGFLSFFSAPVIGAMSDVFGRKPFLLLTVSVTCSPIPLMKISHWWYFTMVSISGIFSVTFSVIFAYVADVTDEKDRSWAYGLVSATFAASLVISPTIGAYLGKIYSDNFVVALATAIALLDIFFVLACVPESLPDNCRVVLPGGKKISWEKADPFGALRRIGNDYLILILCIVVFLSFLPEAGQYSSFFVYIRLIVGFSEESVALFIGFVGIVSCLAQTALLTCLIATVGPKATIVVGLVLEMIQLTIYGLGRQHWMMWLAGGIAGLGSLTYPAISAFVSSHASLDQQGVAQGVLTGIRSLCSGLGPALFGFVFYLFQVDLSGGTGDNIPLSEVSSSIILNAANSSFTAPPSILSLHDFSERVLPGPPFALGAILVLLAILVSLLIPRSPHSSVRISNNKPNSQYWAHSDQEESIGTSDSSTSRQHVHYVGVSTTNTEDYTHHYTSLALHSPQDNNTANIINNSTTTNTIGTPPQFFTHKFADDRFEIEYLNHASYYNEAYDLSQANSNTNLRAIYEADNNDLNDINNDTIDNDNDESTRSLLLDDSSNKRVNIDNTTSFIASSNNVIDNHNNNNNNNSNNNQKYKKSSLFAFPNITLLKRKDNTFINRGLKYLGLETSKQAKS